MNEIRITVFLGVWQCSLYNKKEWLMVGHGDNRWSAIFDLVKACWKYRKMKDLLKVKRIKG